MGKRKKFFRAVAEGIVALSVAFNFVSCGKKTKTEATVLSLGISADDEAALAAFTKQFNADNEDVQVTLRVYATESEKKLLSFPQRGRLRPVRFQLRVFGESL